LVSVSDSVNPPLNPSANPDPLSIGAWRALARRGLSALVTVAAVVACGGSDGDRDESEAAAQEFLASLPVAKQEDYLWSKTLTLRLGADDGRPLGTIFELRGADGELLAAAHFVDGMQSTATNDGRLMQFYLGSNSDPETQVTPPAVVPATARPHPYAPETVFRLGTHNGQLLAYPFYETGPVRRWSPAQARWEDFVHPATALSTERAIRSMQTVDNRLLVIYPDKIRFGSRAVRFDPEAFGVFGVYDISLGLYAHGRMFLAVKRLNADLAGGWEVGLLDCGWRHDDTELADCGYHAIPVAAGTDPSSYRVFGLHALGPRRLLVYGLTGYLASYNSGEWDMLVDIDPTRSWQAYSTITFGTKVLIGHYPTGGVFAFDDAGDGRPPSLELLGRVEPTPAVRRDEVQALMRLGDGLAAGVWPWGEIFLSQDAANWQRLFRAFALPGDEPSYSHPYESTIGSNCLGQRAFQVVPTPMGLAFNTTLKNASCAGWLQALTDEERNEYGSVGFIERTNALSCPFVWSAEPAQISFGVTRDGRMLVTQRGRVLCSKATSGPTWMGRLQRATNTFALQAGDWARVVD
jgi:hypothetical protein